MLTKKKGNHFETASDFFFIFVPKDLLRLKKACACGPPGKFPGASLRNPGIEAVELKVPYLTKKFLNQKSTEQIMITIEHVTIVSIGLTPLIIKFMV